VIVAAVMGKSRDREGPNGDEPASPFRARAEVPLLERTIPVSGDLRRYNRPTLQRDVLAGLTVAALALPSSAAFAEVAGLPPVAGMYALVLPVVAYVVLGSSRRLMIGTDGTMAAMTGAALAPIVAGDPDRAVGAAGALAVLVGAVFLVARVVRLGWMADYFSRPVLIGYIHGVAIVIIAGQIGKLTGVSIDSGRAGAQALEFVREGEDVSATTLGVATASLAALVLLRVLAPKLPAALVVVVVAIVASAIFDLDAHGVATMGDIPSGLPQLRLPSFRAGELGDLVPAAVGIFAVSFADSILTARTYAGRHREHVDANQELVAFGVASAAAGVTQALPISASGSRTAVADGMGVRTQVAALVSVGAVVLVLLFLTGPISLLPSATLGAIIVFAAARVIDPPAWAELWRQARRECAIAAITMIGVIAVGVLPALLVAVALSVFEVVSRSARPHDAVLGYSERFDSWRDVSTHPRVRTTPGVVVYRLDDRLFFANAEYVKGRVREAIAGATPPVHWLVFDAESVASIDSTALAALDQVVAELDRDRIGFAIARARTAFMESIETSGLEHLEAVPQYATVRAAVEACTSGADGDER
jgi:high affinity sulfate transporter 1